MENETPTIEAPPVETEAAPALVVQDDRLLQLISERLSAITTPVAEESLVARVAARVNATTSVETRKRWLNNNELVRSRINDDVADFVSRFFNEEGRQMLRITAEEQFSAFAPRLEVHVGEYIKRCMSPGDSRSAPFFEAIDAEVQQSTDAAIAQARAAASAPEALQTAVAAVVEEALVAVAATSQPQLAEVQQRLDRIRQIEEARSAFSELLTIECGPCLDQPSFQITVAEAPVGGSTDWPTRSSLQQLNSTWVDGITAYGHYISWDALHFLQQKEDGSNFFPGDLTPRGLTILGLLGKVLQLFQAIPQVRMIRNKEANFHMLQHMQGRTRLGRHLLASGYRAIAGPSHIARISGSSVVLPQREINGYCSCEPDISLEESTR
jgi:hypothetical protein